MRFVVRVIMVPFLDAMVMLERVFLQSAQIEDPFGPAKHDSIQLRARETTNLWRTRLLIR